jgi:hypothetical protein
MTLAILDPGLTASLRFADASRRDDGGCGISAEAPRYAQRQSLGWALNDKWKGGDRDNDSRRPVNSPDNAGLEKIRHKVQPSPSGTTSLPGLFQPAGFLWLLSFDNKRK